MEIPNNAIRRLLQHTYFVNGTACAGKSALVKALAEGYFHLER